MITNHTQLLNWLIVKYWFTSYLEIGVQNSSQNYDKIKLPVTHKVGVDPCLELKDNLLPLESDVFFSGNKDAFDLIFIDGLHHADQVKRDFENSLRCLSDNGVIVIHDTLPENEEGTIVPRQTKQWWGDVYKFVFELRSYKGIKFVTIDIDNGCTVVWKSSASYEPISKDNIDWNFYQSYKHLLNIIQSSEIETAI